MPGLRCFGRRRYLSDSVKRRQHGRLDGKVAVIRRDSRHWSAPAEFLSRRGRIVVAAAGGWKARHWPKSSACMPIPPTDVTVEGDGRADGEAVEKSAASDCCS